MFLQCFHRMVNRCFYLGGGAVRREGVMQAAMRPRGLGDRKGLPYMLLHPNMWPDGVKSRCLVRDHPGDEVLLRHREQAHERHKNDTMDERSPNDETLLADERRC